MTVKNQGMKFYNRISIMDKIAQLQSDGHYYIDYGNTKLKVLSYYEIAQKIKLLSENEWEDSINQLGRDEHCKNGVRLLLADFKKGYI